DRQQLPPVAVLERSTREAGRPRFLFRQADVRETEIEETDLLFVGARHDYEQLKHELALHAGKVRKYLVFHGIASSGETGEAADHRELWPTIEEFLREHPQWRLIVRF